MYRPLSIRELIRKEFVTWCTDVCAWESFTKGVRDLMYRLLGMRELYEGSSWPAWESYTKGVRDLMYRLFGLRELYEGSSWPDVQTSGHERVIRREFVNLMYRLFGKERGNQVFIKHYSNEINRAPLYKTSELRAASRSRLPTCSYLFFGRSICVWGPRPKLLK